MQRSWTLDHVGTLVFALTALGAFLLAAAPVTTNDLFWHIETGAHLWRTGSFPDADPFSYTAGDRPWFLHEWLTQLTFFGLHELGGMHLLRVFTGAMAVLILWLVWSLARHLLGARLPAAMTVVAFAILATDRFQTRPTLFSIACFTALVAFLARHRGSWRLRDAAFVVTLTLLWTNLHSVGLLGLVVYAACVPALLLRHHLAGESVARPARAHAATIAATFAATCVTPSGLHLFAFAFQDKGVAMNFIVDEWGAFQLDYASNPALSATGYVLILATLLTVLAVFLATGVALQSATNRLRSAAFPDPVRATLLFVCLGGGLMAVRFHWMVVLSLAFALSHANRLQATGKFGALPARAARTVAAVATLAMFAVHACTDLEYEGTPLYRVVGTSDYYDRPIARSLDLDGIRFLREAGLRGNAFCHYGSGGMLIHALYPDVKVFIDSRADLYGRKLLLDFLAIRDGRPDQQRLLDAYATDLYYRHWEIAPLRNPELWTRIYRGPDGEIFLRKNDRNRANLRRAEAWHARHTEHARHAAAPR